MKAFLSGKYSLQLFLGLTLVFSLIHCSKTVGPIDRDDLVLPDGERALVITTTNSNAAETISAYQLEIISPTGTQSISPAGETHILTTLSNGLYTITSSKDGFVGQTIEFTVVLPAEHTSDYSAALELLLTKLNPPVEIDNSIETAVEAPPVGNTDSGTGANTATLTVPANTITATGTIAISFTQIPPASTSTNPSGLKSASGFGTATTSFDISVYINDVLTYIDFVTPLTMGFALDFSPAMMASGVTARLYAVENGVLTEEYQEVTINEDGTAIVAIPHTGTWQIVEGWEAIFSTATYSKSFTSSCSGRLSANFTYSKGFGPEYSARMQIANSIVTVSKTIDAAAAEWFTRTAIITVPTKNYIMKNKASGAVIESVSGIPQSALSFSINFSAADCHDSGGHDSGGN